MQIWENQGVHWISYLELYVVNTWYGKIRRIFHVILKWLIVAYEEV
jgi:hypothetical protein